jgi:hypothetical protein
MGEPMVKILLSRKNAKLLALNIDGWSDAGACDGGLNADERKALDSAFDQIMRQLVKPKRQ